VIFRIELLLDRRDDAFVSSGLTVAGAKTHREAARSVRDEQPWYAPVNILIRRKQRDA
jgi:hypothetical protein